ncbi:MAG: RagB/SusD family nutrient uptake outer membrane protein [Chitinophagaceae bacterium]|nr:MAG: RagB/SusD family nutrient uptake outer membrane protein [Chitinophagaceae bacterium]
MAIIVTLIVSCQPTLETVPIEQQTLDLVFDSQDSAGVQANKFLYDMYTHIPSIYNRVGDDFLGSATDDAISSNTSNTSVQQLAKGTYSSNGYPDDQWANEYTAIRQANIFIDNIDRVPLIGRLSNGTPMNRVWKAEAKFLRALCYWELVKRYGGVPILGDTVFQLGDNLQIPRNSFGDCINYIASQCDTIADSLRPDPIDPAFIEMPTKAAAMALKARVLLYAASPLYNGGNIDPGSSLTGYTNYSAERWKEAADAAKAIIDLGVFSLDTTSFNDVFITQDNNERIFARQGGNGTRVENGNGPVGYTTQINNGRTSPTQELVDAFGMANGKPITDPTSGYDPQNPYANRDPRLYATVFYNGARWLGRSVETFEGGQDKPGGTHQQTRTGYYLRKFMGDFKNTNVYSNHSDDDILFRYAEVLLNYAEVLNEYLPTPNQDVYNAVEAIRKRAGLNPYQLAPGLTRDQMRTIIHNERRKELAFEDQRYYDVRRWKEADTAFNKTLHEELIYQLGSGQLTYQAVPVFNMVFQSPRMYFAPIPYSEVVKNRNMIQNPGW